MEKIEKIIGKEDIVNEVSDADDPKYMFQTLNTSLVLAIATKKINAVEYAKKEMENRGFDNKGKWVGFELAKKIWKSKI